MDNKLSIAIIISLIILIILYYSSKVPKNSLFDRYTDKLPILTGFFVGIGLYLTYEIFKISQKNITSDITYKLIDRGWTDINYKLMTYYNLCPTFIESLYFPWQKNSVYQEKNNDDKWYAVNYISILIFQSFEDFLTVKDLTETSDYVWICNYIQWCSSDILEHNWNTLKSNFEDRTILLGDLLFKNIHNVKINNVNDIKKIANEIVNSNEYKNIKN